MTPRRVGAGGFVVLAVLGLPGAGTAAADKPRHDLAASAKEIGGDSNTFKLFGRVPTYPGRDLRIERKVNKGPFKAWATEATSADNGRFSIKVYGGKRGSTICYRVIVPSTPEYRTTKGDRWCIKTENS